MYLVEREKNYSRSQATRTLNRTSLFREKCVPSASQKNPLKISPNGKLQVPPQKQNECKKIGSVTVYKRLNAVHLPPLKTDKLTCIPVFSEKRSIAVRNEPYFIPIVVPPCDNGNCKEYTFDSAVLNCNKESTFKPPIKPKPHRLVPLLRQKALEESATLSQQTNNEVLSCAPTCPNTLSGQPTFSHRIANDSTNSFNTARLVANDPASSLKAKKSLLGEFTHFPSFWKIFPAKPSPTILPPLSGFFQSIPNLPPRKTKKMAATSPTLDQSIPTTIITPTVLINHDLLTNGDEDSQEGLSPVLVPTIVNRPPFVHTVSIVVEPVPDDLCDGSSMDEPDTDEFSSTEIDDVLGEKSVANEELVKTVMDHARLRKEEFQLLLEEHAQIVSEIKKAENKIV